MKYFYLLILLFMSLNTSLAQQEQESPKLDKTFETVKWRNIGPFRGGRSVGSSGVINDPNTAYMGTTGGGLWKTTDAGTTWNNISDGFFKTGSVGAVSVSESNPNIVYVGMGEHAPRGVMSSYGDGVYKSTDAGKTWKHLGLEKTQHISRIQIHPTNPDIVYVAAQGQLYGNNKERGVYKSIDGGKSWENILFVDEGTGAVELSMDMNNPLVLYAAMWEHQRLPWKVISGGPGSGLYKSTDGGESWSKIHKGLPAEKGKMAITVSRSNPDKVYALVESDSNAEKGGLFVSNNGGNSWSRISKDHRLVQRAWYYIEVFVDPNNENSVYVLSAAALHSIDGGKTWSTLSGTHGDYHDLWINPNNSKHLVISNDGGAAISFNGGKSWSRQSNMPTAQFYRINVDNLFPYNIYAGQQDNTSVKIAHRTFRSFGISERDWTYSAGGESAFLAFDPENPRYVLGGSYLGTIEVLDTKSGAGTKIMAAPIQYLGRAASDMKYRFNWNAPIIWSQHETNTYYHAAQKLLRTRDMGRSWEEASPDLTNNEKEKQIKGGGPYTVEAVGAENYGTISYVAESKHEKGVIWVTTDDGLVQLTKDNGKNWKNVTPKNLEECLVNMIDISPHDPATAYIATTRYKFNDHTPAIYKTNNYGKSWTNISEGIPYGAYTRVVREDSERKGLLYAGTETGLYISWNDGESWQPFQLNLPNTPINDLMVAHGDLIAATSGRSFWVLDDLKLLQQYEADQKEMKVFEPEEVVLGNSRSPLDYTNKNFKGTNPFLGINPASGAVIYYQLPEADKTKELILEILDKDGKLVRKFSSKRDPSFKRYPGGPSPEPTLSKEKGINRFVWNLRHSTMTGATNVYIEGRYSGHKVGPGEYTLNLRYGDDQSSTTFEVEANPNYPTTPEEYQEYDVFMSQVEAKLSEMHSMVNQLFDCKKQIQELLPRLSKENKNEALAKEGKALLKKISSWDEEMVQRKTKAYDDVENFPNKFTANYIFMINQTDSDIPRVNQPSRDRMKALDNQWKPLKTQGLNLLNKDIPAFNEKLWKNGMGAIFTPGPIKP